MRTITKIESTFYDTATTFGRKTNSVGVVASSWKVTFSTGIEKKYTITLSLDNLDPHYDSLKDPSRTEDDYFIQIDDDPKTFVNYHLSQKAFEEALDSEDRKNYMVTPLRPYTNQIFYLISSKNFAKVSMKSLLNNIERINQISKNTINKTNPSLKVIEEELIRENSNTKKRMSELNLTKQESKYLFHDFFETCLINSIQTKDPSIIDGRVKRATETTPLFENNVSFSFGSVIQGIFAGIFCCKCLS